jgi:Trk-type K+ transport system membrane component
VPSLTPDSDTSQRHPRLPRFFSRLLTVAVLALVIHGIGFVGEITHSFAVMSTVLVTLFAGEQFSNLWRSNDRAAYMKAWAFHLLIALLAMLFTIAAWLTPSLTTGTEKLTLLIYGFIQGGIMVSLGLRALRYQAQITAIDIRPGWLFMGSFLLIIAIGACLLKLPRAVVAGADLSWLDALFTSTSAVCVTGLAVENTAHFFSPTGQVIILGLIQVGGLGIMTLTFYLSSFLFRGMSLHDRHVLGEMISEKHLARVSTTVRFIVLFTLVAEALGAVLLFLALPVQMGTSERLFQAVFHTVSAFCNGGFSTFGDGMADNALAGNVSFQLTICALIVFGSLGAVVVRDTLAWLRNRIRRLRNTSQPRKRLRIHTRLVLLMTVLLILGGGVAIYLSEFILHEGNANAGSALTALFHSITARSGGLHTVDTGAIGPLTVHILVLLMIIGGSPGSTAGGIRTTVFAAATLHLVSLLRGTPVITIFRRQLPPTVGPRALAIIVLTMGWLFVNFALLRQFQPGISDTRLVFELVSAFATVGLSMNVTGELSESARALLIINMFVGRIGLITVASTLAPASFRRSAKLPTEDILLS